nr:hypothetical protein [Tanacetum cinerariifolium]
MQSFNLLKNQVHDSLVSLWATPVEKDTKQKVIGTKDVEDLKVRIEKLEEIFSYLRNRKLKQKEVILKTDDETSSNDDTSLNDEISSSEDLINYLSARDVEYEFPADDEMFLEIDEVAFKIHTKGYFEYDPLSHIMSEINEPKLALFYRKPKKSLEKGLKLLHTNNEVHLFIDVAVKNGFINLYVAHKKQNLKKYYYKNMEWEEEDAGLRCSSSTPFSTRVKTKISKRKKTSVIHDEGDDKNKSLVIGGRKGKEKVIENEGICSKGNKADVTIYKRAMVNRKAKMVEGVGAMKRGKDKGVVIEDGGLLMM